MRPRAQRQRGSGGQSRYRAGGEAGIGALGRPDPQASMIRRGDLPVAPTEVWSAACWASSLPCHPGESRGDTVGEATLSQLALRPERVGELLQVAGRDRVAADAVAARPLVSGQVVGAEQAVEPGELDGEVDVDRLLLDAVVPMVE